MKYEENSVKIKVILAKLYDKCVLRMVQGSWGFWLFYGKVLWLIQNLARVYKN